MQIEHDGRPDVLAPCHDFVVRVHGLWRTTVINLSSSTRLARIARNLARRSAGSHYVAVVAVVLDDDARVLVADHTFRRGWSLPAGWLERGEDPAEAVRRELHEETTLDVEVIGPVACERHGDGEVPVGYEGVSIALLCRPRGDATSAVAASAELLAVRWMDRQDLARLLTPFEMAAVDAATTISRLSPDRGRDGSHR
jgi:8-oxo-dGTP pyrophosphatase MutT (NUDIX family)